MRYIVEPKSRGFDVVDTTATPRADGFWCYCVDRERAQVIADKLNEAPARAKTGSVLDMEGSSVEKFLIHPDLAKNAKIDWADVDLDKPPETDAAIESYNNDVDENGSFGDHARGFLSLTDAAETPGPARAEEENSILSNLSPDARALATYMSDLSEELWCAGWMRDLEFMLWSVVEGKDAYASLTLTRDEVANLRLLSNACKGWIVFRRDTEETFVSMPEWIHLFAAWLSENDPTDKSESK